MGDTIVGVFAIVLAMLAMVALAAGILKVLYWIGELRARPRRKKEREEHFQRLAAPRFDELELHFGRSIPSSVKRLYVNPSLLMREDFFLAPPHSDNPDDARDISAFYPADVQTMKYAWPGLGDTSFPFASDGFGNQYYVPLDKATTEDGPVWLYYHDGGDHEKVADSLATFLQWKAIPREEWGDWISQSSLR